MFGSWQFLTFLIIFLQNNFYVILASESCDNSGVQNTDFADEDTKSETFAKKQYVIEYSDYEHVPKFRTLIGGRNDHFNFVPESNLKMMNEKSEVVFINKCCSWNSYFDVENYHCVEYNEKYLNITFIKFFVGGISNYENSTKYFYVENEPSCDSDSVLSARFLPKVELSSSNIIIDGEQISEYCLDIDPTRLNQTVVLTCQDPKKYCKDKACFRKCCPLKQSYGPTERRCQKTNDPFRPEFYKFSSSVPEKLVSQPDFGVILGDACEKQGKYLLERDEGEISYLSVTGSLYVPMYKKCFARDDFCLEYVEFDNYSEIGSFLCFTKGSSYFENSPLQYLLLSLGLLISSTFLLITFLVYLFSPKSQNLYGKTIMCYIACLFTAYLCLAVVGLKSTELNKHLCIYMGYAILFSFLAAFFWLNVISFDVWKTFSVVRSLERSKSNRSKNTRFLWYSLYAWIFPCVITATCAVVNQMPNFPIHALKPDIGEENCWFSRQTKAIYIFFIAPISIIITTNIFFYIQTAWRIRKVKLDVAQMGKHKHSKFAANRDQFIINGKLFIVMGITWSLEIISFFAPHPIWYITDTANALHGVFIFAVFVLKKKVFQHIFQSLRNPIRSIKQLSTSGSLNSSTSKSMKESKTVINAIGTIASAADSKK